MGKSVLTEVKIIDLYVIFVEFSDYMTLEIVHITTPNYVF